jgi:CRP-like cAMP-binding protein
MNDLVRLLAIRPGEGRLIALVAALFATIEGARGFGEIGADTLFLRRIGADFLPQMYVGLGIISLLVAVAYGAAIGRLDRGRLFVGLLVGLAAILVVLRLAVATGEALAVPALWLSIYIESAVLGTLMWTIAGAVFDARQAKRLFPLCTGAAIAGGFAGTLAAGPVARVAGVETLVLLDAGLLVVTAGLATRIHGALARKARPRGTRASFLTELRAGFDYVRGSSLMRLVAVAYVLFAVLLFSVAFPFFRAVTSAFPTDADLATALGLFSATVTGASFVVALAVANRFYARFGIAAGALALPVVYLVGFAVWLFQFSLATAIGFRLIQQVTQRGLSNAAWSALYNVVPAERRAQVLAFNDGVPGQLGIALSGVLLLAAGSILGPSQVFWMGAVAAMACALVALRIRRRYAESLVRTLRSGLAEQVLEGGPGLEAFARDAHVVDELRLGLSDPSPDVRRLATEILGHVGARRATRDVAVLLHDAEPAVRAAAVAAVASLDGELLTEDVERLAGDPSPTVRAELAVAMHRAGETENPREMLLSLIESPSAEARVAGLRALARVGDDAPSERMAVAMASALADPQPRVRAAAVEAVAAGSDGRADPLAAPLGALRDESRLVRIAAARALRGRADAVSGSLLELLATGPDVSQEAVLIALDGCGDSVRGPLLEWSLGQVERASVLRRRATALAGAAAEQAGATARPTGATARPTGSAQPNADGASADFLRFLLERRASQVEDRLLGAIAVLGAPEAGGLIRRCLHSDDAETRAQAIEALDTLGDRRLGRALVGLIESDGRQRPLATHDVLRALGHDPDPWVRALAMRTLSDDLGNERRSIVARAARDPDPIVRSAMEHSNDPDHPTGGSAMPQSGQTLGEIERMLFLRRVPLFSQLAPEDLQRIAASAIERVYPPEETIFREGDLGDELVVVIEGSVRIIRGEGDEARLVRTYGEGDHIGELAVLRERPRAATVVADKAGVRGLVIGGQALMAILEERPEAAMAMLATLAERISAQ